MFKKSPWVRWSRKRLLYAGQISRGRFLEWAQTPEGLAVVEAEAARIRFMPVGSRWLAQRRLWRGVAEAVRDERIGIAIQREIDAYFERLGEFGYADGLPRDSVELRRLLAVPRVLINSGAYRSISVRLGAELRIRALDGGEELRDWLFLALVDEIEQAIMRAQPSPKRPISAGDTWIAVHANREFVWQIPFRGPAWPGHYYIFELTREPLTRAIRKAVIAKIPAFETSLTSLSRMERNEIVRRAVRAA